MFFLKLYKKKDTVYYDELCKVKKFVCLFVCVALTKKKINPLTIFMKQKAGIQQSENRHFFSKFISFQIISLHNVSIVEYKFIECFYIQYLKKHIKELYNIVVIVDDDVCYI